MTAYSDASPQGGGGTGWRSLGSALIRRSAEERAKPPSRVIGAGNARDATRRARTGRRPARRGARRTARSRPARQPARQCTALAMKTERRPAACAPRRSVSRPSPMARMRSFGTGRPLHALDGGERALVDRQVRLAGIDDLAALGRIVGGQRAGAVDELVAALDHEVGIGADHRHAARQQGVEQRRRSRPASPWCRRRGRSRRCTSAASGGDETHVEALEQARGRAPARCAATAGPARPRSGRAWRRPRSRRRRRRRGRRRARSYAARRR